MGGVTTLTKPFSIDELMARLGGVILPRCAEKCWPPTLPYSPSPTCTMHIDT